MMYAFKLEGVKRQKDPYYVTNWANPYRITVVASTLEAAKAEAARVLGPVGSSDLWVFRSLEITPTCGCSNLNPPGPE